MHEDDSSSVPTAPPVPPDPSRPRLHVRVRGRIRNNKPLDLTWRIGVFVVGALFVVAGLIMFVTPGPGWLALLLGLAILATEFSWAERLLHWAREKAKLAADKALDPRVRRRNILIAIAAIVAAALLVWAYVAAFGWPAPVLSVADWVRSLAD